MPRSREAAERDVLAHYLAHYLLYTASPLRRSAASRLREASVAIVTLVTNVTIVTIGVLANGSSVVVDFNPRQQMSGGVFRNTVSDAFQAYNDRSEY